MPCTESAARARRIRQYEDFFNASGMATPDDLEEFRACQMSYLGKAARWNDMSRGAQHWITGADEAAETIGLKPLLSGARVTSATELTAMKVSSLVATMTRLKISRPS